MRFNQAFHYRDINSGLGIYASSDNSEAFKKACEKICEAFVKEDGSRTAEFVCYSNYFRKFVGIGVSPFESKDKANRLVQIWVPDEASSDPSDYYLRYAYDSVCDKSREYTEEEFDPCISEENYSEILRKYGFSKAGLAGLLAGAAPIIFGKKERLSIVFPEDRLTDEEKRTAAREIMWLLSVLMPVPEELRGDFGSRLTYCVFSQKNRNRVAVSFVDSEPERGQFYRLGYCDPESDRSDHEEAGANAEGKEDLYDALAEKAMESLEAYRTFLGELTDCGLAGEEFDGDTLDLMYFCRQLRSGGVTEIQREDLPIEFNTLVAGAMKSKGYCDLLFRVLALPNDLSKMDLAIVHFNILKDEKNVWSTDPGDLRKTAKQAYEEMLESAFASGDNRFYNNLLVISDQDLRKEALTDLWQKKGEKSCIAGDLGKIEDIDTFLGRLSTYKVLTEIGSFRKKMGEVLFGGDFYFKMDKKERCSVSSLLDPETPDPGTPAFAPWIRVKIKGIFKEGTEKGLIFIGKEKDFLEERYAGEYFDCFLENCRKADKDLRKQVQKTGREFLDSYRTSVSQESQDAFRKIDRDWIRIDLEDTLRQYSLEELADFRFKEFQDYSSEEQKEYADLWLKEVRAGIAESEVPIEPETLKKLTAKARTLERDYPKTAAGLKKTLWEACGDDIHRKILCANEFGSDVYTIWAENLLDPVVYEKIRKEGNGRIEKQRLVGNREADLNRRCYLLWKDCRGISQIQTGRIKDLSKETSGAQLHGQWTALVENMLDWLSGALEMRSYNKCINYLHLYAERARDLTATNRCADYEDLYNGHRAFYRYFLSQLGSYVGEDADYVREMECLKALWETEAVDKENLTETAQILFRAERILGKGCEALRGVQKKYEDVMNEMNNENERIDRAISENLEEIEKRENKIRELESEIDDISESLAGLEAQQRRNRQLAEAARQKRSGIEKVSLDGVEITPLTTAVEKARRETMKRRQEADASRSGKGSGAQKACFSPDARLFT